MTERHHLDLVVHAGQVLSMLDQDAPVTAIGVRDGLIVVTGDSRPAAGWTTSRTLDLGDAVIMPGLTDAHTHPIMGTDMTAGVDLSSATSIGDVRQSLAIAATTASDGWLLAWGLDFNVFTSGPPRGDLFDEVTRGMPLFIRMFDGHSGIANPAAIARCGITGRELFDQASTVDVDQDGTPTGLLREFGALELVQRHLPVPSEEEFATRLLANLSAMSATGLTGGLAMDFIGEPVSMLERAEAIADLPLRLRFSPWCNPGASTADLEHLLALQQVGGRRWGLRGSSCSSTAQSTMEPHGYSIQTVTVSHERATGPTRPTMRGLCSGWTGTGCRPQRTRPVTVAFSLHSTRSPVLSVPSIASNTSRLRRPPWWSVSPSRVWLRVCSRPMERTTRRPTRTTIGRCDLGRNAVPTGGRRGGFGTAARSSHSVPPGRSLPSIPAQ